jgi:hypothetical protein
MELLTFIHVFDDSREQFIIRVTPLIGLLLLVPRCPLLLGVIFCLFEELFNSGEHQDVDKGESLL